MTLSNNQSYVLNEIQRRGRVENLFQFGVRELGFEYAHIHTIINALNKRKLIRKSRSDEHPRPLVLEAERELA